MTDETNGNNSSFKDELAKFEKILNEYQTQTGIKHIQRNDEVDDILRLTSSQIAGMTALQCGEAAFLLFQYATYIQKEQNRHVVRRNWAESHLERLLGKYGEQYGDKYTKYEERKAKLIAANTAASMLQQIVLHAAARSSDLYDMANKITMMGKALLEYQNAKTRGGI